MGTARLKLKGLERPRMQRRPYQPHKGLLHVQNSPFRTKKAKYLVYFINLFILAKNDTAGNPYQVRNTQQITEIP